MPTVFNNKIKFKATPEERLDEFDFVGGLVTDAHETKLDPNQSPNLANVVFNETGSIKTRNGYSRYNNDPIGSSSDESNTATSTGTITLDSPNDFVAQTFQVGTNASIDQADFYLAMNTSGETQYMRVELWSGSTGPSAYLAQSQILLVSGTSETEYSFRFNVPYALTASTEYALVLRPFVRGTTQTINTVLVHHTADEYANGGAYTSTDAGNGWAAVATTDLKFNVYTGGNTGGTGLFRYYNTDGTKQMFAKIGTTLYRGDDGTGAMTAITLGNGSTFDANGFLDYTIVNDTLLVVDRNNYIQKYNGSTNANYSTGSIDVTNGSANVTGNGTSWNTSTNAEIGEYIKLPDGKWYRITSIGSDTSIVIEVEYQGNTLSTQNYTISPWGEIQGRLGTATATSGLIRPQPDFITNHINRIWTLDGNTLRFSALDTSITEEHFNDWDSSNNAGTIIIPSKGGETGTGLYSLNGYLYVFQDNAIWEIFGTGPSNFELRNISNEVGLADKRTLVEYDRYLLFYSGTDIYLFDGVNLKNLTDTRIRQAISQWANDTTPVATLWDNKYVITYTPNGGSYNSESLFYDINRDVWSKFTGTYFSDWANWNGNTDSDQVYAISSVQGSIYQWDVGGNDDGYEIQSLYDTPSLSMGIQMNDKTIKKFYIQQLALGDWDLNVTQYSDILADTIISSVNLNPGNASLWDVAQWDVDTWSATGTLISTRIAEFQGNAKYYKFRFEQTGYDEGIEILGITLTAKARRLR